MSTARKKKPAKPTPSHLLSRLVHIRAELDDLIRAAEAEAAKDAGDWKGRCQIKKAKQGNYLVVSPCGWYWWGPISRRWLRMCENSIGFSSTEGHARDTLDACTVPPPPVHDWKERCEIVKAVDDCHNVLSPCGRYWWSSCYQEWHPLYANDIGIYDTENDARRALAACTVQPPAEGG